MTYEQWKKKSDAIDVRLTEWWDKYEDALDWFETFDGVSLLKKYGCHSADVSERIEIDGVDIYEVVEDEDDDVVGRKKVTRKAIRRLRHIEHKIDEWIGRSYDWDLIELDDE